jgi:phosphotriesterase-related protein
MATTAGGGRSTRAPAAANARIRTATGDIDADAIGPTLIHEHLICDLSTYWRPEDSPEHAHLTVDMSTLADVRQHAFAVRHDLALDRIDQAVDGLLRFRDAGGGLLVEVTSHGIGRDARALAAISRASGVPVIVGCGYYVGASRPRGFGRRTVDELTAELVEEIDEGIGTTGIWAGVIGEIGVGQHPMLDHERRMLRASARAQVATGAGMVVHPAPGSESAFEIVKVLASAGAIMEKVVVSHLDERLRGDIRLFRRLGSSGVRFGFDTFGREIYFEPRQRQHPNDAQRIEAIVALWDAGLGERVTLAQDICLRHELAAYGGQGYDHILNSIVPRMRIAGIPDAAVDQMLVRTPAAVLAMPATGS